MFEKLKKRFETNPQERESTEVGSDLENNQLKEDVAPIDPEIRSEEEQDRINKLREDLGLEVETQEQPTTTIDLEAVEANLEKVDATLESKMDELRTSIDTENPEAVAEALSSLETDLSESLETLTAESESFSVLEAHAMSMAESAETTVIDAYKNRIEEIGIRAQTHAIEVFEDSRTLLLRLGASILGGAMVSNFVSQNVPKNWQEAAFFGLTALITTAVAFGPSIANVIRQQRERGEDKVAFDSAKEDLETYLSNNYSEEEIKLIKRSLEGTGESYRDFYNRIEKDTKEQLHNPSDENQEQHATA